jgi:hypothetical protein
LPLTWHDWQEVVECFPVNANFVVLWSNVAGDHDSVEWQVSQVWLKTPATWLGFAAV